MTSVAVRLKMLRCFPVTQISEEERSELRLNRAINKQLKKEKKDFKNTFRLLLLGAGESGKSTIVKQMKIIHMGGYNELERKSMVSVIRRNLRDAILAIVGAMDQICPPEPLEHAENAPRLEYLFSTASKFEEDFPEEFYETCRILWRDEGVQRTMSRSNEFQVIDSAKYFLDRIDELSRPDYDPSEQDLLRCRVLTCGISETRFVYDKVNFHMFDVGGQRSERHRWVQCFNDIASIIFIAACSAWDMVLREDKTKNRLVESLELFELVWSNKWLQHVPIVLFLNKQDLLEEKVFNGKSNLEDYFPEYQIVKDSEKPANKEQLLESIRNFILEKFMELSNDRVVKTKNNTRLCYPHFTCAVDTKHIENVFKGCRDYLQRRNIHTYVNL